MSANAELAQGRLLQVIACAVGSCIGIAVLLCWLSVPAHAESKRIFEETFGSAAQPGFVQPTNLAVDYGTGELYVVDVGTGAKTLTRWNPNGTAAPFSGLGTNVIDAKKGPGGKECIEEPASCDWDGNAANVGLSFPIGAAGRRLVQVAIDESGGVTDGNIYLTQRGLNLIDIFGADGKFLGQLHPVGACGVAVDGDGAIYVGRGDAGDDGGLNKYVPSANPPTDADLVDEFNDPTSYSRPCSVAAGAGPTSGYLFVNKLNPARFVYKVDRDTGESIGEPLRIDPLLGNSESTVSVFPGNGHVFVGGAVGLFGGTPEVKEFDASGESQITVSSAVLSAASAGFAASAAGERLYVARASSTVLDVFGAPLPLAVVTAEAVNLGEGTVTLQGTIAREGLEVEGCNFEYIDDVAFRENEEAEVDPFTGAASPGCAESNAEINAGAEPFSVHVDLSGLAAGELFHFRLNATTEAGAAKSEKGDFATTVPPMIEDERVSGITTSEATIRVRINPKFYATGFHIEYGPGSLALRTPEIDAGADGIARPLIASLNGLEPGTAYQWKVVASREANIVPEEFAVSESSVHTFATYRNFAPEADCPNHGLRAGASIALPDCRAYEMVSPVDKSGGNIVNGPNGQGQHDAYIQATPDGERIAYSAEPAFAGQLSSRFYNQYVADRGAGGWVNRGVNLPLGEEFSGLFRFEREVNAFSEDLCSMWTFDYNVIPLTADAQPGFNNLYRRQNCAPGRGSLEALTTAVPAKGTRREYVSRDSVQGLSAEGSAAFFVAIGKLTDNAVAGDRAQVYLHSASGSPLRLVSILPNGTAAQPLAGTGNAVGGGASGNLDNAVSDDGTHVFWTASGSSSGQGKLYLRENPVAAETTEDDGEGNCVRHPSLACTIEVSDGTAATFWGATPSGSAAIYSEGNLAEGLGTLYRFEGAAEPPTQLVAKLYGVAGVGEDLGRIYLVSGEAHDGGVEDAPNLYLYEGGAFTLIGTLLAGDVSTLNPGAVSRVNPNRRATRVTPDGRRLLFQSRAPLTGYDNADAGDLFSGEPAVEVFLYESGQGLRCISCNPAGIRPQAGELPNPYLYPWNQKGVPTEIPAAAWIPTWEHPLHASRLLSADGDRAFFHSFDPLLPRDTNGTVQDLYQWESPGTGSCETSDASYFAANGGCIDLISSGTSSREVEFFDASADGRHTFFTTPSSLVPEDPGVPGRLDVDLYDAHVGGGYTPPARLAACEGDACQDPPPPPEAATPASAAYIGPENAMQSGTCLPAARRAAKLSRQAKRLRRRAARMTARGSGPRAVKRLGRQARRRARVAKRSSRAAKRCRRANRRAAR